ncbi:GrpB family protein [Streptomyces sp. NPDC101194]|uniref:GrpB family protein n=1 Tax=Streptomyces sp. NPDC101194 TaxID=3366127 RepID=UPI00382F1DE9
MGRPVRGARRESPPCARGRRRGSSTSDRPRCPGPAAKPITGMLLIVEDADAEESFVPALVAAGFEPRVREGGHRMLRTPERDAHLHVHGEGAGEIQDYRDLRDWLRHDRADRDMYAAKKRELAKKEEWPDMNDRAQAKDDVVALVLAHARARRAGGRAQDDRATT